MNPYAVCKACGDSGISSTGVICVPCFNKGRYKSRRYAVWGKTPAGQPPEHLAGPSYNVNKLREFTPPADSVAYIVLLGTKPKPIARWSKGRWHRKKKRP